MVYMNTSCTVKTFYGVTFKPNEVKEVNGYINDPKFIRLPSMPKEPPKVTEKAQAASAPAQSASVKKEKEKAGSDTESSTKEVRSDG